VAAQSQWGIGGIKEEARRSDPAPHVPMAMNAGGRPRGRETGLSDRRQETPLAVHGLRLLGHGPLYGNERASSPLTRRHRYVLENMGFRGRILFGWSGECFTWGQ
jgi:hypothetical protein